MGASDMTRRVLCVVPSTTTNLDAMSTAPLLRYPDSVKWNRGDRTRRADKHVNAHARAAERFEALWRGFRPKVRARLRAQRLLDQSVDADDLEQEVYLRLWQALANDRTIEQPASYIYRTINAAVIDAARRAQAREASRRGNVAPDDIAAGAQANPEPSSQRGEITDAVSRQFDQMKPDRVQAIKLHLQGYTTHEIGRITGWTEARARNLVYRGLSQLRGELDDELTDLGSGS